MEISNNKLPNIDLYGKEIPKESIFFNIPKNIGDILFAQSSFREGNRQLNSKELLILFLKWSAILLTISCGIIFGFKIISPPGIVVLIGIALLVSWRIVHNAKKYNHACWYIGSNGFAISHFKDSMENVKSIEICFDDVTDLYKSSTKKYVNSNYQHTNYEFVYMNDSTIVYQIEEKYVNEKNEEGKYTFLYHFLSLAEKQWTHKLTASLYDDIKNNGFISFNYITHKYLIKVNLGLSFIEYATSNNEQTVRYEKDNIHSLFFKNGVLIMTLITQIEEKYFLGLFKKLKDEQIGFSLQHLSNQSYFLYALQTLWNIQL